MPASQHPCRRSRAGVAAVTALLIAGAVHAQDSGDDASGSITLDEVNIEAGDLQGLSAWAPFSGYNATQSAGATKTDTPLSETPQSVTVIGEDQIADQHARSLREVLRYTGGTVPEVRGNVATRYDQVRLRGFLPEVYLDGLYTVGGYYAEPQVDPYLVERVEVIKGPASVLYGQTPPGGLVNMVSKRPRDERHGEISLGIGSSDLREGAFDVGGPLGEDGRLSYRLTGIGMSADGGVETTEEERYSFAPALTWRPTDETAITLLASYRADPESTAYGSVPVNGSLLDNPNGELPRDFYDGDTGFEDFDRKQRMIGYVFEHQLNDVLTFRQNVRYERVRVDYKSVYASSLMADNRTLARATAASREDLDGVAVDNQMIARFGTGAWDHTVLAGIDYRTQSNDRATGFGTAPTLDIYDPDNSQSITDPVRTDYESDSEQLGGYLQEQARVGSWVFLLGGRYDDFEQISRTEGSETGDLEDHAFTGRAGALYEFDNGLSPYVSYMESFQPETGTDRNGETFDPTRGEQWEAGVKFVPPGENALVTLSAFQLTQKNVTTPDPVNPTYSVQTGEIRVRGAELEGKASLGNGLSVSAVFTVLDPEVTEANASGAGVNQEGNAPIQTPERTGSLWLDYDVPASGRLGGLELGGGVRYVGEQYADSANDVEVPSYTLLDAAVRYDLGAFDRSMDGWRMALNVSNLTDKKYVTSCYADYGWCWWGEGRKATLTVSYNWK
ncbi:TonB-dependent siderophore receptor [Arhodomonas sp. KWT2]|uniref:TonB-dependent siderophore receptor n=3 Tax=unclassified Arhodomonas TaxID=2621637 RepID=UPI0035C08CAE